MRAAALALLIASAPAAALDLNLPGEATLVREVDRAEDTYFLPTDIFGSGAVPSLELEGRVVRQAWQITGEDLSTLGLLAAIRDQLQAQGYEMLLDCAGEECGGFDFRFGIDVLPAPDMFVDLFDYRFLTAKNDTGPDAQYVSALVSRAGAVGYIQLVLANDGGAAILPAPAVAEEEQPPEAQPDPMPQDTPAGDTLAATLVAHGRVILRDLVFATGSSTLQDGPYASLSDLSDMLKADPDARVILVGHTDAVGGLDGNLRLSRERAASVMSRLIADYDVPQAQLSFDGMGFLAPVATNATDEGRRANRRVEAVLLATQ